MARKKSTEITIKQLASKSGVSMSTISRFYNGTSSISNDTRSKILYAARELGYKKVEPKTANRRGDIVEVKPTYTLVTAYQHIHNVSNNQASYTIFDGIKRECAASNVDLISHVSYGDKVCVNSLDNFLKENESDAIIVVWDDSAELIDYLATQVKPCVIINGEDNTMRVDTVSPNNFYAARQGAKYLLDNGHKNILMLSFNGRETIRQRNSGFRSAYKDKFERINYNNEIYADEATEDSAIKHLSLWIENNEKEFGDITAIFCTSDILAMGVMKRLNELKIRVPNDISIIGMDDVLPVDMLSTPLTTVKVPFKTLPKVAMKLIGESMFAKNNYSQRIEIGAEVVVRESVKNLYKDIL